MKVDVVVVIAVPDVLIDAKFFGVGYELPGLQDITKYRSQRFIASFAHALQHLNLFLFAIAVGLKPIEILSAHGHPSGIHSDSTTTRQADNCSE